MTHTIPLLFAGAGCSLMDFDGVRALVVLPELPVAGGAVGAVPASLVLLDALDDGRVLRVDSLVRALVVLPEFAPAVGSVVELPLVPELETLPESFEALFEFLLPDVPVLPSPATGVSPVGGVALAEGSATALFLGLLIAVGVVFAFSPSVFPLWLLLLLREEVAEAPEPLVELAVPDASFESVFFLVVVFFFAVVEVSPEFSCEDFAGSVESAAGFFFFFVAVESLCDWSADCVDCADRKVLACDVPMRPKPSNAAINTAMRKVLFIVVPWLRVPAPVSVASFASLYLAASILNVAGSA